MRREGMALPKVEVERRLAAIMVADVVGYSRLVEADEKHTLAALRTLHSEVIDPAIARHRGRIVKLTGDGFLADFASVVAAVAAAVDIQKGVAAEQVDILPARRIVFRIGVNLGDVVVEGDDLLGDGVNVAARLEQICPPGDVYVSGSAHDQLDGKLELRLDAVGEQHVKNIARPIRVYRVRLDGVARPAMRKMSWSRKLFPWAAAALALTVLAAAAWWFYPVRQAIPGPSMMVRPFDNLSDDKEQGYLAVGISEDLTTELARVPGLFVLSRTAAFDIDDPEKGAQQIAREMGVRYVLEGSVRRVGDDLRINAQLIDAASGGHLWAERYDGAWSDVLVLQNKVVSEVATALELRLTWSDGDATNGGTTNAAEYDAFLRGLELKSRGSPRDLAEAVQQFKRAIELDPTYGHAIAELAWVYYNSTGNEELERALGTGTLLETIKLAQATFSKAMRYPSARGYQLAGERHISHWESDLAIADLEHARTLDPSDVWNHRHLARAKILGGDAAEGLTNIEASLRVDPREVQWTTSLRGLAEFSLEHYADAAASLETTLNGPAPNNYNNLLPLMATYGKLGAADKANALRKDLDAYAEAYGDKGMTALLGPQHIPFMQLEDALRLQDGLIRAGIPDLPFDFDPKSKDRLSGDEMHALMYGHTIAGRVERAIDPGIKLIKDYKVGVPWSVTTSADGSSVRYIWGDIHNSGGRIHHEGDRDCLYFLYEKVCAAIFRNPSGTREQQNEYYWLIHWYLITFSVEQ